MWVRYSTVWASIARKSLKVVPPSHGCCDAGSGLADGGLPQPTRIDLITDQKHQNSVTMVRLYTCRCRNSASSLSWSARVTFVPFVQQHPCNGTNVTAPPVASSGSAAPQDANVAPLRLQQTSPSSLFFFFFGFFALRLPDRKTFCRRFDSNCRNAGHKTLPLCKS